MSKPDIIEGIVRHKRDLGGLIFFQIETVAKIVDAAARKDAVDSKIYKEIKSLAIDDFCQLEVGFEENDRVIYKLLSHIEKKTDFSWNNKEKEIVRAYAFILNTVREFFTTNGYTEVRLPSIHFGRISGDIFELDFFGKSARLTSSNSLFLDVYTVQLQKAFSIQKCFRAEKSHTTKHLAEFDMLEVARLNSSLEKAMAELEHLLKFVLAQFEKSSFSRLNKLDFAGIIDKNFPVIQYREIENRYQLKGKGLGKYEREIARDIPVFVIDFPRKVASWTARPVNGTYARSFNLLLPGVGEAAEGTEKQTDMEMFRKKLQTTGMENQLGWYLRMVPYSNFLLSGFGLGIERLAMWLLGLKNIRKIHPVYRDTDFSELKKQ